MSEKLLCEHNRIQQTDNGMEQFFIMAHVTPYALLTLRRCITWLGLIDEDVYMDVI